MSSLKEIISLLQAGTKMIGKGAQARRKANRLRRQRSLLRRGHRGIPSNAVQLLGRARRQHGFSNLPHHNIRIHEVFYAQNGSYAPGDYKLTLKVLPFKWLQNSPYSPLLDIYEKMRINTYSISVYLPTISPVAKASSAAWLAKDSTVITGIDSYPKILEQPGHKRGRGHTIFRFVWKPVEPEDLDYRECASAFDTFDWGTLLYSMIGAASEFPEQPNPIIEYRATYSFANLRAPNGEDSQAKYAHIDWSEYNNIPPLDNPDHPDECGDTRGSTRNRVTTNESDSDESDSILVVDVPSSVCPQLSEQEHQQLLHLLGKLNLHDTANKISCAREPQ